MRFWVVALAAFGVARTATAEPAQGAAELEAKGAALAKDAHYTEAIDAFKAADKLEPRASHVCLIALAYTRREAWPQAELFLDKCHERASVTDPLPDWVPLADQQLKERLATANVAAVTLVVEPDVPATFVASSFAPDETFGPRTIHLGLGNQTISVQAPGYETATQTFTVTDRTEQRLVFALKKPGAVVPARPMLPPPPPPPRASKLPWIIMGAGGAVMLAGLGVHLFALEPVRDKLQTAQDMNDLVAWTANERKFDTRRTITLALYGVGAVAIAAGAILQVTVFKHTETALAIAPTSGGMMMSFEVRR